MLLLPLLACRAPPTAVAPPAADPTSTAAELLDTTDMDPQFAELATWTAEQMEPWALPGAAIAIVEDGELRHVTGLGLRKWGEPDLVTADTLFRVGSVSKLFAGAIVAEEAAAGRLDLAAPASSLLPELTLDGPYTFDDFTFLQLASHSAGMQTNGVPKTCDTDPAGLGAAFASLTPEWAIWTPPGELYNYANQHFGLLGLAAERTSGENYPDLAQRLFDAAGMTSTTLDSVVGTAAEHATGHQVDLETGEPTSYHTFDERACIASYPSGGIMSSARDLGRALEVLLAQGDGWMSPEAWEIMTTQGWARSETSGYGFGLISDDYGGYPTLSHSGSVGGYFALITLVPSEGLGIAVLVNSSTVLTSPPTPHCKTTHRIMRHALDMYLGTEEEFASESTVRPTEEFDRFVGEFHSDYDMGDVVVTLEEETVWLSDADRTVPLLPYSRNGFYWLEPDTEDDYRGVLFYPDETGAVKWLITSDGAGLIQGI